MSTSPAGVPTCTHRLDTPLPLRFTTIRRSRRGLGRTGATGLPPDEVQARLHARGIGDLSYYNVAVHSALFALPSTSESWSSHEHRVAAALPTGAAMPLKSILVFVDFGPADGAALQRAGQLAAAYRATLRLLHAAPGGVPTPTDVTRRLTSGGRQLQERTGARVKTVPAPARTLSQVTAEAKWSDLVVVADCHERSVAAFFLANPCSGCCAAALVPCWWCVRRQQGGMNVCWCAARARQRG